MKSIDFLKQELTTIYSSFSYLEIKYEFRKHLNTHVIEVKPTHCFESDKLYIDEQICLEDAFEENYPFEEILFITDNILIQIENPILELGVSTFEVIETEPSNIVTAFACPVYDDMIFGEVNFSALDTSYSYFEVPPDKIKLPPKRCESDIVKKDSGYYSESFFLCNIAI
jgi:hypothetical protein